MCPVIPEKPGRAWAETMENRNPEERKIGRKARERKAERPLLVPWRVIVNGPRPSSTIGPQFPTTVQPLEDMKQLPVRPFPSLSIRRI